MEVSLTTLPVELLLEVFRSLARTTSPHDCTIHPARSILAIASTCKAMYKFVKENDHNIWRAAYETLMVDATAKGAGGRYTPLHLPPFNTSSTPLTLMSGGTSWKQTYMVYRGWQARRAKALVFFGSEPSDGQHVSGSEDTPASVNQTSHDPYGEEDDPLRLERKDHRTRSPLLPSIPAAWVDICNGMTQALACGTVVYSDVVPVPRLRLMVRSNRLLSRRSDIGEDEIDINNSNEDEEEDRPNKTMMQVLDGRTGKILDVDCMNRHRQVVSKMAINDAQDYLVSSSTDGTVRVWTFTYDMKAEKREALPPKERNCPLRCMHVLQHESGWVHDVSIQGTTIVSGGGDCAFRIWDARTGEQLYSLTGLHRRHSLGVQAIALQGSLIATGSPFDRYCVWQTDSSNHPYRIGQEARNSSGESSSYDESEMAAIVDCSRTTNFRGPYRLLHVLDEPLTSREHHHFENVESQYYRTRVVITPTVYITNSKRRGMLCIWSRTTGRMLHRIWVTSVMTGLLPKEAQVNKPDGPSFHSPFYHHNAPVDTIDGAMDNGSIPAATQRQKVAGDAYSMRVVSFADNAFVDTDEPHPLHGHGEDSFDDDEEVDYSPEDEVMCERIHDFETDATGEFLMVTMTTGRMVLFQFGASPMDRPIKLQPRMLRTMDDEIVSSARWILFTNAQGELLVDRV